MKYRKTEKDKQVEKMIKNWDKIKCGNCGKKISMLDAILDRSGEYFICKGGCK